MSISIPSFSVLLTSLIFIPFTVITGQLLSTEYLNVKLPIPNGCPRPHYDGSDTIFLFGGCGSFSVFNNILKFSISTETLQVVGSLPGTGIYGTVQPDAFGNIFYIGGGYPSATQVYKYDPATNNSIMVATLPYDVENSISTKYNTTSNTVLILGGYGQGQELLAFDIETGTTDTVDSNLAHYVKSGTSITVGNKAYIFTRTETGENKMALELDLDTFELKQVGQPTLPVFGILPSSVFDGTFAYVVGGYELEDIRTDGLIQFDPITFENSFLPVRNFPVEGSNYWQAAPASVFVPSNNRIYFFGGQSFNYTGNKFAYHDEIFYIDLTPLVESTTTDTMLKGSNDHNPKRTT